MDATEKKLVFPHKPRFTPETLQEIRFSTGDSETTIAAYTITQDGKPVTRYDSIEGLTHAERETALAFILKYAKGQTIRRKGKPRGRAGKAPEKMPPPLDLEKIEFEPVDIESLTADNTSAILDQIDAPQE